MSAKIYEKKSFTKEEWAEQVAASTAATLGDMSGSVNDMTSGKRKENGSTSAEPTIPKLLLNYFVCMAYEESSVRMARELGYVKSNKDVQEFNDLYKIRERAHISELLKRGQVSEAMEEINSIFGIEVLECGAAGSWNDPGSTADGSSNGNTAKSNGKEDLHFKLLLLNLIEMIRAHDQQRSQRSDGDDSDDDFVLKLIEYSQEKLALKAASNKSYMAELELVMTLLLFPKNGSSKAKLPKSLKNLYSLSLRSNIADLVNRKLLRCLHPQVANHASHNAKFPDLIGFSNGIIGKQFSHYNEMLVVRPKEDIAQSLITEKMGDLRESADSYLRSSVTSVSEDWSRTTDLIKEQQKNDSKNTTQSADQFPNDDFNLSEYQYETKLVQIMKLWAWCENQLHNNDIGAPRVESSI